MKEPHLLPTSDQVDPRLRVVAELRTLCLSLGRARPVANLPSPRFQAESEIEGAEPVPTGHAQRPADSIGPLSPPSSLVFVVKFARPGAQQPEQGHDPG